MRSFAYRLPLAAACRLNRHQQMADASGETIKLPDGHNLKPTLVGIGMTGLSPGGFSPISPGTKIPGQVNQFVGG